MILELLEGAVAAASPPSFATVTRDALRKDGGKGPSLSVASALDVARAVAQAIAYLHGKGLVHGDVYLHNTLVVLDEGSSKGAGASPAVCDVRLSDFGAAAAVDGEDFEALRRLEARSFGWLLQDL